MCVSFCTSKYLLVAKFSQSTYILLKLDLVGKFYNLGFVLVLGQFYWSFITLNKDIRHEIINNVLDKSRICSTLLYVMMCVTTHRCRRFDYQTTLKILNVKVNKNRPLQEKGVIFMSNHYTALDNIVIRSLTDNDTFSIFKSDLITQRKHKNFFVSLLSFVEKPFFKACNAIAYKRGDSKSGETVKSEINQNMNIIIFPEGTSTRSGVSKEFKNGIFFLAAEHNIPIVPITLHYSKDIGIDPGGKLDLFEWINTNVRVVVHDKLQSADYLELKNSTFNLIINTGVPERLPRAALHGQVAIESGLRPVA